jgi:hypothetical protein
VTPWRCRVPVKSSLVNWLPWSVLKISVDLLRQSGEFPVSNEELDDTATTVYEGI